MKADGIGNSIENLPSRLLWLWVGNLCVLAFVAYAFIATVLSFRELLIAVLMVAATNVVLIMVVAKELAKKVSEPVENNGHLIDLDTRKRLRWRIRMAKIRVGLFVIAFLIAIKEIRNGPLVPFLVGFIIALYITAKSIQSIIQSEKTLAGLKNEETS